MHRFKVGQKVVAIRDHELGSFEQGDIFTVESLWSCDSCGEEAIFLKELTKTVYSQCINCGTYYPNIRQRYAEKRFTLKQYQEQ